VIERDPQEAQRKPVPISYALEPDLSAEEFRTVLIASTLAQRRPVEDSARLDKMLRNADLAVDGAYQRKGIGKRLIEETHRAAGETTTLTLVAAPAAESYYLAIGMKQHHSCWTIPRKR
jgi:GNAT superfamily N-acetyltransferase